MIGRRAGDRKDVAGGDCLQGAVGKTQEQPPVLIERFEAPEELPIRKPHAHVAADPGGAGEPVGANGAEAGASVPLREPPQHRGG